MSPNHPPARIESSMIDKECLLALDLDDGRIKGLRHDIYHSSGPGFVVFRSFISADLVEHMRRVWSTVPSSYFFRHPGKHLLFQDTPNLLIEYGDDFSKAFCNFPHNAPVDEATGYVATLVHLIRNRLQGHAPLDELFQWGERVLSYRVVRSGEGHSVERHSDFSPDAKANPFDKIDQPERLQATLFLSNHGEDYRGGGFELEATDGRIVRFGVDEPVSAGDLIIWRYPLPHEVTPVTPLSSCGFLRILFPSERLVQGNYWRRALKDGELIYVTADPVEHEGVMKRVALRHA